MGPPTATSSSAPRSKAASAAPSLTKLDATNNLVPTTDFRTLYATGLAWLGVHDTEVILGGRFDPVGVLS